MVGLKMPPSIFVEKLAIFFQALLSLKVILCVFLLCLCVWSGILTLWWQFQREREAFTKQFFKAILRGAFRKSPRISFAPSCLKTGLFRLNYE